MQICGLVPLAGFLKFLDLAFYDLAFEGAHLVEKHDAITVIGFVQHAARCQFHAVEFEPLAFHILCAHNRSQAAFDGCENSRKRQTAFLAILISFDTQAPRD